MNAIRIALPLAALLIAGPAFAQPGHDEHHPAAAAAPAAKAAPADQAAMHEKCKAMMGDKMDAKHPHEHSADKQGVTTHPRGVKPTAAEMEKMHKQCEQMMASAQPPAKK